MKIELFFLFLCASGILISYMTKNINKYSGNSFELREINSLQKNYTIDIPTSLNYLIPINNKYLLGCEYRPEVYNKNLYLIDKIENEKIYSINIENNEYKEIKINDFPESVPFHPHGMSLYLTKEKNYILYVLNHAVNYNYEGQERIEKFIIRFESKKISLNYERTIKLPDKYFLRIESITAIDENLFFFTTNSAFENPRDSDELIDFKQKLKYMKNNLLKIISPMLNIKNCYVYLYNNENKEISIVDKSEAIIYGGITFDTKRNLLYAIKPMEKEMNIFSINNGHAELIKTLPTLYVGNNIFYDNNDDKIYIGINGKKSEEELLIKTLNNNKNIENIKTFSGYEILNPADDYGINDLMIMKDNNFKWINSAIKVNEKIYMSSIYSKGIFICEKNK